MNEAVHQSSFYQSCLAKWRSSTTAEKFLALGVSAYVGLAVAKASFVGILRCLGFSSNGPLANSWAAAWQSAVAQYSRGSGHSLGRALFSFAQHVSMTWHIFTPSAAILGFPTAVYFSSGYISQSARSVLRAGIFGGEEESRNMLQNSDNYEVQGPVMMEVDEGAAVADNAPDLIILEEEGGEV